MKKLLFLVLLIVQAAWTMAADRVITGHVIAAEDKQPLIGVSVFVSADDLKKAGSNKTSLGVITDIDGNFSISIPEGVKKLQCSYIGYTTLTIELKPGKKNYDVTMETSSTMLEDVVVTGYQTIERRKLTAAVSKIDISESTIGTDCRIVCDIYFRCTGCAGKNPYSWYFFFEWYTRSFVGTRWYSFGRYRCAQFGIFEKRR